MKKITIALIMLLSSSSLFAQFQVGGGVSYGWTVSRPGLTAKALGTLSEKWKLSPGFTYYTHDNFNHSGFSLPFGKVNELYSVDLDFHKQLKLKGLKKLTPYLIAGVNYSFIVFNIPANPNGSTDRLIRDTTNEMAINLGVGANYQISKMSNLYYEAKAILFGDFEQSAFNLGFMTTIGVGK